MQQVRRAKTCVNAGRQSLVVTGTQLICGNNWSVPGDEPSFSQAQQV
jgi:hypothetical protein